MSDKTSPGSVKTKAHLLLALAPQLKERVLALGNPQLAQDWRGGDVSIRRLGVAGSGRNPSNPVVTHLVVP